MDIVFDGERSDKKGLIPIRKPSNRKDYFVFGLGDRTNLSESIYVVRQTKLSCTEI